MNRFRLSPMALSFGLVLTVFSSQALPGTPLNCGSLESGTLAAGSQVDQYTYAANAGEIVTLTLAAVGQWEYTVSPVFTLYDPSGKAVLSNASGMQQITLAMTGTYVIQVYSNNSGYGGNYSLGLDCRNPANPATVLSCGALPSGTLAGAKVDQYTFAGQARGIITLTLAAVGQWEYTVSPVFTLYDPSGKAVLSNASGMQQITLAMTGTYLVQVYSNNMGYGGTYSFGLDCRNPAGAATALSCGSLVSGSLAGAKVDQYAFAGQAGGIMTLTLAAVGQWEYTVSPVFTLYDPSGNAVLSNVSGMQEITLAMTGTYLAQVYSNNMGYGGTYSFGSECITGMSGEAFVPIKPCRIADTRGNGFSGSFGPPSMTAGSTRTFPIGSSECGIPSDAQAYSLNVTVVPPAALEYLTIWPTGELQPLASTLNSFDGQVVANAAIVPAGSSGSVNVYVSNETDVIIDIDGYFVPENGSADAFYTDTPCRIADTRSGSGFTGPFGPPGLNGGATRAFPMLSSGCIPAAGDSYYKAYSLNVTVVPPGPLDYISLWPEGESQPVVSTLNSLNGRVVANAALVPAGTPNGGLDVYASNNTNLVVDIDGHFGPPGDSSKTTLYLYPLSPCRIADTRAGQGFTGAFGPPSMGAGKTRSFPIPTSSCGIPSTAQAYSLNMTVVPASAPFYYLSVWPTGQPQPYVSTLNSYDGTVVANAALVPAGTSGSINVYASNNTDLIIDIDGYFAP